VVKIGGELLQYLNIFTQQETIYSYDKNGVIVTEKIRQPGVIVTESSR
jgi:hypothetical protein